MHSKIRALISISISVEEMWIARTVYTPVKSVRIKVKQSQRYHALVLKGLKQFTICIVSLITIVAAICTYACNDSTAH